MLSATMLQVDSASQDLLSKDLNIRNIACNYHTFVSNINNRINIVRRGHLENGDIIIPEYLELTFNDLNRDNLVDVKKLVLIMKIGGRKIEQFPIGLLINFNEPIICDDKMYINLCFDMLFVDIKLCGLYLNDISFDFVICNNESLNYISTFGIVVKQTFLSADEILSFNKPSEKIIQQISIIDVKYASTTNIFQLNRLPFLLISKGFFIECENINNLNNILLKLNNLERFNYNQFLLQTKCKKITQNLLYFPFNYDKNYTDRTKESYEGGINFLSIENISLTLKFNIPVKDIKIYSLNSNLYRQMSQMGGLAVDDILWYEIIDTIRYNELCIKLIENIFCPITHEIINVGDKYMLCNQCKNIFDEYALQKWLYIKTNKERNCPLCRTPWTNFNIYINGETI